MKFQFQPKQIYSYEKGSVLFREGEPCHQVGFLLEGKLTIASVSFLGNEILYKELYPGDFFGNNLIYSESPLYRGDIVCQETSQVVLLNKKEFERKLYEDSDFLSYYLSYQAKDARQLNERIKLLSFVSAEERIMYYLSMHSPLLVESVSDLASTLNLRRETVSRILHQWQNEGKIRWEEKKIRLIK